MKRNNDSIVSGEKEMAITSGMIRITLEGKTSAIEARGMLEHQTGHIVPVSKVVGLGSVLLKELLSAREKLECERSSLTSEPVLKRLFQLVDESVGKSHD